MTNKYGLTSYNFIQCQMSHNEFEFCKINVDFKEFKLNNARFYL